MRRYAAIGTPCGLCWGEAHLPPLHARDYPLRTARDHRVRRCRLFTARLERALGAHLGRLARVVKEPVGGLALAAGRQHRRHAVDLRHCFPLLTSLCLSLLLPRLLYRLLPPRRRLLARDVQACAHLAVAVADELLGARRNPWHIVDAILLARRRRRQRLARLALAVEPRGGRVRHARRVAAHAAAACDARLFALVRRSHAHGRRQWCRRMLIEALETFEQLISAPFEEELLRQRVHLGGEGVPVVHV